MKNTFINACSPLLKKISKKIKAFFEPHLL